MPNSSAPDSKNGLPIDDDSDIFDVFAELEREQRKGEGRPIVNDNKFDPREILFDDDLGVSSIEGSFFGDGALDDSRKGSS